MYKTLEIGPRSYVKDVFPADTVYVATGFQSIPEEIESGSLNFSLPNLRRVVSMLKGGEFDAIVVHAPSHSPMTLKGLSRIIFGRHLMTGQFPLVRSIGSLLPGQVKVSTPMSMVDFEDHTYIARHNLPLLRASTLAFKRELPADRWRMFSGHGNSRHPSSRFRIRSPASPHLEKIRPLPLGLKLNANLEPIVAPREKTADIFFAGLVKGNSTVRSRGIPELLALRDAGFRVDLPDTVLPPSEFLERCAAAWMVWSPEGLGWDCFRHYETPLTWSVPLINLPTIERHEALVEGRHAFYYDPVAGGLTAAFRAAIGDKNRLLAMARDGRAHVLQHHTPAAIARYIVSNTVDAGRNRAT